MRTSADARELGCVGGGVAMRGNGDAWEWRCVGVAVRGSGGAWECSEWGLARRNSGKWEWGCVRAWVLVCGLCDMLEPKYVKAAEAKLFSAAPFVISV